MARIGIVLGADQFHFLGQVLDSLDTAAMLIDGDECIVAWNTSYLTFFPEHTGLIHPGWPYPENLRHYFTLNTAESERGNLDQIIAQAIARHRNMVHPLVFQNPDGRWMRSQIFWAPDGSCLKIWTDPGKLSAIFQAGDEISMSNAVNDGIAVFSPDGRFMLANRRMTDFFPTAVDLFNEHSTYRDHLRRYCDTIFDASEAAKLGVLMERQRPSEVPLLDPLVIRRRDGRWMKMEERIGFDGRLNVLWTDVSALKSMDSAIVELNRLVQEREQARRETEAALRRSEAASQAKSSFLAMMSHEIRTPMNGILGMVRLLMESPLSEEQSDFAGTVYHSVEALLSILNDILDFSKLEAGKLDIEPTDIDLPQLITGVLALMSPRAAEKGLKLEQRIDPALPRWISIDPVRLRQVLLNLVGNAVKFTQHGSVSLSVRHIGDAPDGRPFARFAVADTGIGIAPETAEHLFTEFTQADNTITRRFGGTGLGLAICKKLVQLFGSRIDVSSVPGEGSTFSFTLPLSAASGPPRPIGSAADRDGGAPQVPPLSILLAEDNLVNQKVAVAMLRKRGHQVTVVGDGGQAVDAVGAKDYDVVLMDVQMPLVDGLEATRRIRALPPPRNRVAVIAMTANAMKGDEQRCLDAGMDGYVSKPIDPGQLDAALLRHVAARVT